MKSFRKPLAMLGAAVFLFGAGWLAGEHKVNRPATVLHVITIQWKPGVTDAQKQELLAATEKMASAVNGIRSIWLKPLKVQPAGYTGAMVMEFDSQAAFKAYTDDPAHKAWEKVYLPLRAESRTHDITN